MPRPHTANALGFAVRKDIRNNLVREVDRVKHRHMWETACVLAMLLAVVLIAAWQHLELRNYGYEIGRLETEQAIEEAAGRQLRLEIETLQSPSRIEDLAVKKLHMIAPAQDDAIVIERVSQPTPPPRSIVASTSATEDPR